LIRIEVLLEEVLVVFQTEDLIVVVLEIDKIDHVLVRIEALIEVLIEPQEKDPTLIDQKEVLIENQVLIQIDLIELLESQEMIEEALGAGIVNHLVVLEDQVHLVQEVVLEEDLVDLEELDDLVQDHLGPEEDHQDLVVLVDQDDLVRVLMLEEEEIISNAQILVLVLDPILTQKTEIEQIDKNIMKQKTMSFLFVECNLFWQ